MGESIVLVACGVAIVVLAVVLEWPAICRRRPARQCPPDINPKLTKPPRADFYAYVKGTRDACVGRENGKRAYPDGSLQQRLYINGWLDGLAILGRETNTPDYPDVDEFWATSADMFNFAEDEYHEGYWDIWEDVDRAELLGPGTRYYRRGRRHAEADKKLKEEAEHAQA